MHCQIPQQALPPDAVPGTIRRSFHVTLEELLSGSSRCGLLFRYYLLGLTFLTFIKSDFSHLIRTERVLCYFLEPESGYAVPAEKEFTIQACCVSIRPFSYVQVPWAMELCRFALDGEMEHESFVKRGMQRTVSCKPSFSC